MGKYTDLSMMYSLLEANMHTRSNSPQHLRDARHIVANPRPGDPETLRKLAWFAIKRARGQIVHQRNLHPVCGARAGAKAHG
jgi:hypothetical protein